MQIMDEIMFLMTTSLFEVGFNFSFMRVLRILRLIRIIRVIRILRLIGELRTIVASILGSLRSLCWTVVLLFLLVYVFGVYLTQLVLDHRVSQEFDAEEAASLVLYFGSLGSSVLSLYQGITGGVDWSQLSAPLISQLSATVGFIFCFYIAFALLALLNVVTGVFVQTALKSGKDDRDMYMLHHVRRLFQDFEHDKGETQLSWDDFEAQLGSPSMVEFFKAIDVDESEARGIFSLLDADDSGQIDLDEFLNGCLGLHGPAKALHLSTLMYETRLMSKHQVSSLKRLEQGLEQALRRLQPLEALAARGGADLAPRAPRKPQPVEDVPFAHGDPLDDVVPRQTPATRMPSMLSKST